MKPELRPGIMVISQKGRDKGRALVVLCALDAEFVLVADGDLRPVERPKKKRAKHVTAQAFDCDDLLALYEAKRLTNADVQKAVKRFETERNPVSMTKEGQMFV